MGNMNNLPGFGDYEHFAVTDPRDPRFVDSNCTCEYDGTCEYCCVEFCREYPDDAGKKFFELQSEVESIRYQVARLQEQLDGARTFKGMAS